ncbi:MAG: ornithine cyclodeaminase family protein [Paucibacter sp.]|nr:ornithine cyclodeaminase family protein [Roseateles sp.]
MQLITESQVAALLTPTAARQALYEAFMQMGRGQASVLARHRAAAELDGAALALSAMGAVLPAAGVMGTKVYSTRNGQFQFVVTLFSAVTGLPLATLEANELTRLRTSAATAVAADALASTDAKVLAVFGAGTQARAHVEALQLVRKFDRVLVCARSGAAEFAASIGAEVADAATAAREADVIVTATRSNEPLFDGTLVKPGAFVAAVGSSKPVARELDDTLLSRAALIAVEWKTAAETEAGEFRRAGPGVITPERVAELGSLLAAPRPRNPQDIIVYKSVGIGLEDLAIAHWIHQQLKA